MNRTVVQDMVVLQHEVLLEAVYDIIEFYIWEQISSCYESGYGGLKSPWICLKTYPKTDHYPGFQKCFTDSESQHRSYAGSGKDRTRDREVENIEKTGNFKQ